MFLFAAGNNEQLTASVGFTQQVSPTAFDFQQNKLHVAGLFLFAAGNNGQLTDSTDITQQFFPADYGLANQISVGASDTNDALASFSNYGA